MADVGTYDCAFCSNKQPVDEPYLAWDWHICRDCMQDLEKDCYEDHERRKKERAEDEADAAG